MGMGGKISFDSARMSMLSFSAALERAIQLLRYASFQQYKVGNDYYSYAYPYLMNHQVLNPF